MEAEHSMHEAPPAGVTLCAACERDIGPGRVNLVCKLCGGWGFCADWDAIAKEWADTENGRGGAGA